MLLQVVALFSSLVSKAQSSSINACASGWFGKGCLFQCHCRYVQACGEDGECPVSCEAGYFGPGCQYVNHIWNNTLGNEPYLIDEDENTCNNRKDATEVTVRFTQGIALTWFRLYVNYSKVLHDFTVLLDKFACPNERRFAVSQMAMDVSCDVDNIVSSLSLKGPVAPYVCSIYVSKGRNVALRQAANQSSTYATGTASKAVDGNRSQEYYAGSCTHTNSERYVAEWSLHFNRPYSVYSLVIYNRAGYTDRLKNFTILTYNEKQQVTNRWMEAESKLKYVLQLKSRAPIVVLKIQQHLQDTHNFRLVTLCEVEAYGEALCPDAYYGLACDKKCKCEFRDTCFTVTGECAPGCPVGEYGDHCAKDCNPECRTGFCYQRLGICESCNPGFIGAYCTKECDDGKYGFNCNKSCSKYCDGVCDKRNGWCKCPPPYIGNDCTECERGTYGVNCSKTCPTGCEESLCDMETGECLSCSGLRKGNSCDECPEKTFGSWCSSNCSIYCLNGTCDPDNGTCPICVDGYSGPRCIQASVDDSSPLMNVLVAVVFLVVLALMVSCFLLQKLCKKFTEAAIEKASNAYSGASSG